MKTAGKVIVLSPNKHSHLPAVFDVEDYLPVSLREGFTSAQTLLQNIILTIQLTPTAAGLCHCGRSVSLVHDVSTRLVRECAILDYRVLLCVPVRRLRCNCCGVKTEVISWLQPRARLTNRFIQQVEQLLWLMPTQHVVQLTGLRPVSGDY